MPPILLFLLALTAPFPTAAGSVGADPAATRPRLSAGVLLNPVWSRTNGFGVGAALRADHLLWAGSSLRLVARPNQHLGRYGLTFRTADPHASRLYGMANGFYETMGRHWYYGLGPATVEEAEVTVERERSEVELRVGTSLAGGRVFVEPRLRLVRYRVNGYRPWEPGALEALDERSREHLRYVAGETGSAVRDGAWYGLGAGVDTRDARARSTRGLLVQTTYERYTSGAEPNVRLDRLGASAYAFLPLGRLLPAGAGAQVLTLRVAVETTRDRGEAPVPFYLLPSLNGGLASGYAWDRFVGADLLALSLEYRMLLFDAFGLLGLEGLLSLHAASVYDDLFAQFEPAVSFERRLAPGRRTYPLRPGLGVGARVVSLFEDRVYLEGTLGLSPEGLGAVSIGFVYDLRSLAWYKR